jgi:hypothetical protein
VVYQSASLALASRVIRSCSKVAAECVKAAKTRIQDVVQDLVIIHCHVSYVIFVFNCLFASSSGTILLLITRK